MVARIAAVGVVALTLSPVHASQAPINDVTTLEWMAGCWTRTLPDGVNEEHWMKPSGGSMLGMSRTVQGSRTTEFEFIRIADVDGALAYIARPSGQTEASFRVKTLTDHEVVFENPAHDFPQRVIYRRTDDGSVTARIEGTIDGKPRARDFPFTRCR